MPNCIPVELSCWADLILLPWIESKPRNHSVTSFAPGLVVVGLPASQRRSPNIKLFSELPLLKSHFFALLVDVFSDGLWRCRNGRPYAIENLAP